MNTKIVENISVSRAALLEIMIAGLLIGVCASLLGSIVFEMLKSNMVFLVF